MVLQIAIDSRDALGADPRGWGRYTRELVGALPTVNGVDLSLLTGEKWPGPEVLWEQIGVPLALRRKRADVLHAPNCFLALRRPCPGVVTIHDLAFEVFPGDFEPRTRAKYRYFTPRAARSAQAVVCVSEFTRGDVCERYGVDPAKVHVVPNAPSLAIGDAPVPAGEYLLGVGDLRAKKNWRRLVEAWLLLRREGLEHRLVIAGGDAGEAAALRAAAGDAPLELPGYVADRALDALMRGAAALVHPSLYEGFGLVVAEALARGTPVAAAGTTALPEAGGDAAVYFDPHDPAAIAAGIREALTGERIQRGLARAAELSWERTARETVAVYAAAAR